MDGTPDDFFGVLMQEDLTVTTTLKWRRPRQTRELADDLLKSAQAARPEVVMEANGTYGDAFYRRLTRQGLAVYAVSTKQAHDLREVYERVPSPHDPNSTRP